MDGVVGAGVGAGDGVEVEVGLVFGNSPAGSTGGIDVVAVTCPRTIGS